MAPFTSPGAAWTEGGQPLAYVSVGDIGFSFDFYTPEWLGKMARAQAAKPGVLIPVEQVKAQVLLLCAETDVVWPSCPMARMIETRAKDNGLTSIRLLAYANAGHYAFGVPIAESNPRFWRLSTLGGTGKDTNAALADGWEKTRAFLSEALKAPAS